MVDNENLNEALWNLLFPPLQNCKCVTFIHIYFIFIYFVAVKLPH